MSYDLHPLCTLFPRMDGAEFDALVADIKTNGQREPIIIHDGMILDGGNRYRACLAAGVEPAIMKFGGGNIVAYVLSANLHRRHMTAGQQAAIVASAQEWAAAQAVGRPKKSRHDQQEKSGNVTGLTTVADRQAQSGASDKTQRMADKVAKAAPDLAKQVAHGEISLPKAVAKIDGKDSPKPIKKPADIDPATLQAEIDRLKEELDAVRDNAAELARDLERYTAIESGQSDEMIKRLQIENAALKHRIQAITTEKNEAIKDCKYWRKQAEKRA